MRYVIYDVSGRILRTLSCPDNQLAVNIQPGEQYAESDAATYASHYFDHVAGMVSPKQDYTLEALPLPCTLTIEDIEYTVTEQPTFTFNYPGTYTIEVDAGVQYLNKTFEYEQL